MNKEHKDLDVINLEAPRLASYKQKKCKKHQHTVSWVDINLALKKGLKFYQTRWNAIFLYDTLPAYCIPKAIMMESVYASPRPPPKISFKNNWMKELGSEIAGGSEDSQQTQPNPIVSTGRPVKSEQQSGSRALHADLQQNNAYNPFSDESKAMIREMGNAELFELCETIQKSAMLRMPSLLESRNCPLHLWTSLEGK